MQCKRILTLYSSKSNCEKVRGSEKLPDYIHLDAVAVSTQMSLMKLFSNRKKSFPLKTGDRVVAVDDPPICTFISDAESEDLLHFTSLVGFSCWLHKQYTQPEM